jgi:hypothetical protein
LKRSRLVGGEDELLQEVGVLAGEDKAIRERLCGPASATGTGALLDGLRLAPASDWLSLLSSALSLSQDWEVFMASDSSIELFLFRYDDSTLILLSIALWSMKLEPALSVELERSLESPRYFHRKTGLRVFVSCIFSISPTLTSTLATSYKRRILAVDFHELSVTLENTKREETQTALTYFSAGDLLHSRFLPFE